MSFSKKTSTKAGDSPDVSSDNLKKLINLYLQDETFSSHEANILLTEAGLKRKKRDKKDDALAAAIILESFITKIKSRISTTL
jgi:RNase H-fold protein (predicted Holliday junction resolvase)